MIVIDASVAIAIFSPRDIHHDTAVRLMSDHAEAGFILHTVTLAEILVGAVRAGRAHEMVARLRHMGVEEFEQPPGEAMTLAELRASTGLKMPDCCVLSIAVRGLIPLATFDDRLATAARTRGIRVIGTEHVSDAPR